MNPNVIVNDLPDQYIVSLGEFLINKSKSTEGYYTLVSENDSPEKVIFGVDEGMYQISYCENLGLTCRKLIESEIEELKKRNSKKQMSRNTEG